MKIKREECIEFLERLDDEHQRAALENPNWRWYGYYTAREKSLEEQVNEIIARRKHEQRELENACLVFVLKIAAGVLAGLIFFYLLLAHAEGLL